MFIDVKYKYVLSDYEVHSEGYIHIFSTSKMFLLYFQYKMSVFFKWQTDILKKLYSTCVASSKY